MFFGKRKKLAQKNQLDRNVIDVNYKMIDALVVLCTDDDFNTELKKLQEQLKYQISSTNDKVCSFDKKIKSAIDDLKIALTKEGDAKNNAKAQSLLREIRVLIAERNSYL